MQAQLLLRQRTVLRPEVFKELVIWLVPAPLAGSAHRFKYRLALVVNGVCVLRYDNEAGKGDHVHVGELETEYVFGGIERLLDDFEASVKGVLDGHADHR
jgi:hypothetical protein